MRRRTRVALSAWVLALVIEWPQLKEALKGLPGAMSVKVGDSQVTSEATSSQKLDEILKRLGKLEKEVEGLKKKLQ